MANVPDRPAQRIKFLIVGERTKEVGGIDCVDEEGGRILEFYSLEMILTEIKEKTKKFSSKQFLIHTQMLLKISLSTEELLE